MMGMASEGGEGVGEDQGRLWRLSLPWVTGCHWSCPWQLSCPAGDTLPSPAMNCAWPKLFHVSCVSPALMNSSKYE